MKKAYRGYKAEDFLLDEAFLDWVLHNKNDSFWNSLIDDNEELKNEVRKAKLLLWAMKGIEKESPLNYNMNLRKQMIWDSINSKYFIHKKKIKRENSILSLAASLIILIAVGTLLITRNNLSLEEDVILTDKGIKPSDEVLLVLANGSSVKINDSEKDLKEMDGTQIMNKSNRTLIYNKQEEKIKLKEIYNQIIIPRGKRHNLILADGTKVWLNSESTLRFPTQFVHNKRIVFLEGEGYFEVAPNEKRPFVVKTANIDINVKGTSFNVKAYKNDMVCETTLEEGVVEVNKKGDSQNIILKPGRQAKYNIQDKTVNIENVETKFYTSWRKGQYIFQSEKLESLIVTINRWYDVNVHCDNQEVLNYKFTGVISEDRPIEHIMELIRLSSKINYTINGEDIYITK